MTSIEWLENELKKSVQYYLLIEDIVEQAKELHKQEILNAWDEGKFEGRFNGEKKSEQYYQEKFKK